MYIQIIDIGLSNFKKNCTYENILLIITIYISNNNIHIYVL